MQTFETLERNKDWNQVIARLINNFVTTHYKYVPFQSDIILYTLCVFHK